VDIELVQSKRRPSSRSLHFLEPDAAAAAFTSAFLALDFAAFLIGADYFLTGTALAAFTGLAAGLAAAAFPLPAALVTAFLAFVAFAISLILVLLVRILIFY
jgi:hypothetical protein